MIGDGMSEGWFEGEIRSFDEVCALARHRKAEVAKLEARVMELETVVVWERMAELEALVKE